MASLCANCNGEMRAIEQTPETEIQECPLCGKRIYISKKDDPKETKQ